MSTAPTTVAADQENVTPTVHAPISMDEDNASRVLVQLRGCAHADREIAVNESSTKECCVDPDIAQTLLLLSEPRDEETPQHDEPPDPFAKLRGKFRRSRRRSRRAEQQPPPCAPRTSVGNAGGSGSSACPSPMTALEVQARVQAELQVLKDHVLSVELARRERLGVAETRWSTMGGLGTANDGEEGDEFAAGSTDESKDQATFYFNEETGNRMHVEEHEWEGRSGEEKPTLGRFGKDKAMDEAMSELLALFRLGFKEKYFDGEVSRIFSKSKRHGGVSDSEAFQRLWARLGVSFGPGQQRAKIDGVNYGYKTALTEYLLSHSDNLDLQDFKLQLRRAIVKVAALQWKQLVLLEEEKAQELALYIHDGLFLSEVLGIREFGVVCYCKFDCILTLKGDWAKCASKTNQTSPL